MSSKSRAAPKKLNVTHIMPSQDRKAWVISLSNGECARVSMRRAPKAKDAEKLAVQVVKNSPTLPPLHWHDIK